MKRLILGLVLLAGLGVAIWFGLKGSGSADEPKPVMRQALQVPRIQVAALGRVESRSEEMQVAAAMTGRLASVPVEEGDAVTQGQVLATLENADYEARVRGAEAQLAVARASLDKVMNGARQAERDEAKAAVAEAEAVLALAKLEVERQQGLAGHQAGSKQDLDRARSEQEVAEARLSLARFHLGVVDGAPRVDDQAQAEAQVALAEARLDEARALLDKSFVRSPVNGVVLRKMRHPGEQVTEMGETPIVTVGDISLLRVRAEVDEADIGLVHLGQSAYVRADAYGDRRFGGKVTRIGSLVGRKTLRADQPSERADTRVLEVMIDLDPGATLPVGLRVDAHLDLAPRPG